MMLPMDARVSFLRLFPLCLLICCANHAPAATVFQDGFESGSLSPAWTVLTTRDGRATVSTNHVPASGQWHLILDDSADDALYSVAECTLRLDLANKKNVVLSFKAKSLGNEPHDYPYDGPRAFDGVSVSTDEGATWRTVGYLAYVGTIWANFSILLDYPVYYGQPFGADVRIRFSEYDNAGAPLDGIAIDDVVVTAEDDQRAILEIPARVIEGSGPHSGHVLLSFAPTQALTLALSISPTGQISAPVSVEVPAGQKIASFTFSVLDDNVVNLTRFMTMAATASGVTAIPNYLTILDDEPLVVTLHVPAQLTEGVVSNDNALVSLDRAPDVPFTIYFDAPCCELQFWDSSVTIPTGQTQAVFTVNASDDTRIDGNTPVTIFAVAADAGLVVASNQVTVVDNETRILSLALPATVQEGSFGTGTVSVSGTLLTNLEVSLVSANPTALTVPPTVTIVAYETQATFPMTAVDNGLRDGSRPVMISATANTFTDSNQMVTIRDNELAGYRFGALSNIVNLSRPLDIEVSAADVEGNAIAGFTGTINLSIVLPGGTTLPLTPATVNLSGTNGWTGSVTFPTVNVSPLRLRASDANGNSGDSAPFDIMRMLDLVAAADLVWDSSRSRFYASVSSSTAGGTNSNRVLVIDPATAAISGSVLLAQNPGQLALTSGGENLYVALNGNGNIVRIDPSSMAVASIFAVGTDSTYGTFYAADMCAVAGQPNLLVISRSGPNGYEHYGVAAYDNGVARLTNTPFLNGSRVIEPSANPGIFFGYDNRNDYGFRRLQLDASGMTEIEVNRTLLQDYDSDILSDGNRVFSTSGVELDGAQMTRLGAFPLGQPLYPDLAVNRVYFIERQEPYSWENYDTISAYDPLTFSSIRKATMSSPVQLPKGLIRWGTNGLAFLTSSNVVLINSSQLVPGDPPANLIVGIQAVPNPTSVAVPLTYTVTVSNQGPNLARNTILKTELSAHQTIQSVVATTGTAAVSSNNISLPAGDLAVGASATLVITALPQSAGSLVCIAKAFGDPPDPDFANNSATNLVRVGYELALDAVSELRLLANNLIYDSNRNLLWASTPQYDPQLGQSVVSINPLTGVISEPLAIGARPMEESMALSANGRYLYVGLENSNAVHRIDLESSNASVRIPLDQGVALDLEPLAGDGTSFLAATYYSGVVAFNGAVQRPNHTDPYIITRIEKTSDPGIFIGASYNTVSRLAVTASGVAVTQSVNGLIPGSQEIRGDGNLLLGGSGHLVNSSNLTLRANFGISGSPCLDLPNHRAYLVNGDGLHAFDTETLLPAGNFVIPGTSMVGSAQTCVRWGLDGFAILSTSGIIYVLRWSSTIPAFTDSDANGFSDAWEAAYFGTLNVDPAGDDDGDRIPNFLEYLFVMSPIEPSASPTQVSTGTVGNQMALRLVFPRRAGLSPRPYEYLFSSDLTQWTTVTNDSETVLAVHNADGIQIETVEALIPATNPVSGFVRLRWNPH